MSDDRPVRIGLRVDSQNPGHTRVSVFIGRNEGARGRSGELVIRTDEWEEIRSCLARGEPFDVDMMEPLEKVKEQLGWK